MPLAAIGEYLAPRTLEGAAQALTWELVGILAGGTDLLPRWSAGREQRPRVLVDLKGVEDLRGVTRGSGEVIIGACTPLSEIASHEVIREAGPLLAEAAGRVACCQIRNRATIGGNLCNASPAADTAVPLILLDAVLDLASATPGGLTARKVPIVEFFRGPGATALGPAEILTHIRFKPQSSEVFAAWDKFGTRPSMEIAVASVGVALLIEADTVTHARVGYGSVAPVPWRGRKAEAELMGQPLTAKVIEKCEAAAREEIAPISDVRASAAYRREVVGTMLRRMLEHARAG
jgi:CO/xanthine dehydrogenase FAD-binding subunit